MEIGITEKDKERDKKSISFHLSKLHENINDCDPEAIINAISTKELIRNAYNNKSIDSYEFNKISHEVTRLANNFKKNCFCSKE